MIFSAHPRGKSLFQRLKIFNSVPIPPDSPDLSSAPPYVRFHPKSKDLHSFNRPHLEATAIIAHGRAVMFALGEGHVPKDWSWTCDVVMACLHRIPAHEDLRDATLIVRADNCVQEVKNNSLQRLTASLLWSSVAFCHVRERRRGGWIDVSGTASYVSWCLDTPTRTSTLRHLLLSTCRMAGAPQQAAHTCRLCALRASFPGSKLDSTTRARRVLTP